jgi:hypothetical protein
MGQQPRNKTGKNPGEKSLGKKQLCSLPVRERERKRREKEKQRERFFPGGKMSS